MTKADDIRRALESMAQTDIRDALAAMGEDPTAVQRYLESELAGIQQKGLDRVREAEAHLRRGPTRYTLNTRLRLYEPIELKVRRASLHRAIEKRCELSAHAAMLLADLGTWGEVPIDSSYRDALEELCRRGLAEQRYPLDSDPDARVRAAPTPFVAEVIEQIRALGALEEETQRLSTPRTKATTASKRSKARRP